MPGKKAAVMFTHTSPHGDGGYPGNLAVTVMMTLTSADELRIDYSATTDRATPANLTNHDYFNLAGGGKKLAPCATVFEPTTGCVMEVLTTEPGVQLYTGNWLDGTLRGHGGTYYAQHSGFCTETQHFPDSANQPELPSIVLRPGQTYRQTSVHKFSTR